MIIAITILSVLLVTAIIMAVIAVVYVNKLTKEQYLYLDTVKMYERFILSCPSCRCKVDQNWKKIKQRHTGRS